MNPLTYEIAFTLAKARQADLIREADEFRRAAQAKRKPIAAQGHQTTHTHVWKRASSRQAPAFR
jgi:hypothetical protein